MSGDGGEHVEVAHPTDAVKLHSEEDARHQDGGVKGHVQCGGVNEGDAGEWSSTADSELVAAQSTLAALKGEAEKNTSNMERLFALQLENQDLATGGGSKGRKESGQGEVDRQRGNGGVESEKITEFFSVEAKQQEPEEKEKAGKMVEEDGGMVEEAGGMMEVPEKSALTMAYAVTPAQSTGEKEITSAQERSLADGGVRKKESRDVVVGGSEAGSKDVIGSGAVTGKASSGLSEEVMGEEDVETEAKEWVDVFGSGELLKKVCISLPHVSLHACMLSAIQLVGV